jgi:hypothetical protein
MHLLWPGVLPPTRQLAPGFLCTKVTGCHGAQILRRVGLPICLEFLAFGTVIVRSDELIAYLTARAEETQYRRENAPAKQQDRIELVPHKWPALAAANNEVEC